ncbi:MAG: response regulator [Thermomicrobiales bacterium]
MAAKCIAIINNESAIVRLLSDLLQAEGYTTTLWAGSTDAHAMVRDELPDLIILDISIDAPMSGLVVLDLLKLDPATTEIPVIACSTNLALLREQEGRLRELNCTIQPKPFAFAQILAAVVGVIGPGSEH